MKMSKANARDKKQFKKKHGMRVSGKSVFTIVAAQVKRAQESK